MAYPPPPAEDSCCGLGDRSPPASPARVIVYGYPPAPLSELPTCCLESAMACEFASGFVSQNGNSEPTFQLPPEIVTRNPEKMLVWFASTNGGEAVGTWYAVPPATKTYYDGSGVDQGTIGDLSIMPSFTISGDNITITGMGAGPHVVYIRQLCL